MPDISPERPMIPEDPDSPQDPEPIYVEHGPLMTLAEAARLTGRNLRVLQRWAKSGILPARYKQAKWPYGTLVTYADLDAITDRKRWGTKRTRARKHRTDAGHEIVLRGQVQTATRLPED